jgi:hypothetical protein
MAGLLAPARVMDQAVDGLAGVGAGPQAHLQSVEGQVGAQALEELPADYPAGIDVDGGGGVHQPAKVRQ